jgi:arabinan endo-1,5-alpha-L-arabinosidase
MRPLLAIAAVVVVACGSDDAASADGGVEASAADGGADGASDDAGDAATGDAADEATADAARPCATRITYGDAWIHGPSHPDAFDDVSALVTWDGACTDDGANSFATLSNGFKPYFTGHSACVLALDYTGACAGVPTSCTTRVAYGAAWIAGPGHTARFDDVAGRVFSDGACASGGGQSHATLSNGWTPYFTGTDSCGLSFEYRNCGGLYANPTIPFDCPDPGVLVDGNQYVLTCTSGGAANAYPIFTSPDLVHFTARAHVFPAGHWPTWAQGDFWAPEIHKVGAAYVAYFSARNADGRLSIGAAYAASALGPYTDIGHPLIHDANMGLIDASEINASNGKKYVLWKEDGNAQGRPTPIHAQELATDGLSLVGTAATLVTNDQSWEGPLVEGPFMVEHGGSYWLFYSANAYYNATYAVGVARAASPLGPFTKASGPILTTGGAWVGPGHCSVVDTPAGDSYMVYHAWKSGAVNTPGAGRLVLVDAISWGAGGPTVPLAPSNHSRPMP